MRNRSIQIKVIKALYAKSGNICAFPGCSCKLLMDNENISEICHIQRLNPESARYNAHLSNTEVNSIDNLILLCPTHHSLVDQQPLKYTVEWLKKIKATHENWVAQQLHNCDDNPKIFYKELQKIFQESQFDAIFLEQNFCSPFPDSFIDSVEIGYLRIRKLLENKCALNISGETKEELYLFTVLMERVITVVAIKSYPSNSDYATPSYNEQDKKFIKEYIETIRKLYIKHRFK